MTRLGSVLLALVLVTVSCGGSDHNETGGHETGPVYAAALIHLVTEDNTFGASHTFSEYLIQRVLDSAAGSGMATSGSTGALSDSDIAAIEVAFASYEYRWIEDPAEWRSPDLNPVIGGSVILGAGSIEFDSDGALVPVSLWCGGVCGFWATYRMVQDGDQWVFSDYEGQIAIS